MFCHGSLLLTVVVGLASSFPQLFGSGKLPLVENIPIPLPPKVDAEIPSVSWGILDKIGLTGLLRFLGLLSTAIPGLNSIMDAKPSFPAFGVPGSPAVGGSPSELQNLNHRISRLEAVLKLEGRIQLVGDKMMATNGKEEDFATSNSSCNLIGGRIVTPMNEAENSAALVFVKKYNSYAFLGMTQGPVPGAFCYLNGTPVVFTHWRKGEPSGKGTEGCTEMYTDGQWNDKACNYKRLTICEI
ncbi:pulmonary surfactant-associated protein A2-like isoform X1 [Ranitomeya variabilis]|uniref:pulmonary surfactant-associated protein A2-like isoform X1 n=1 Tax=Ranitomeya variabilis TaxID=490064 RepID=UPI0040574F19